MHSNGCKPSNVNDDWDENFYDRHAISVDRKDELKHTFGIDGDIDNYDQ